MTDSQSRRVQDLGRRLLVIHNPTAGRRARRRFDRTIGALSALGCEIRIRRTGGRGDAESFARDAARTGDVDRVVAAGGDGTVNEVVNGLAGGLAGTPLPLAILPLGTANVLATEIGLSRDPARLAETIAGAEPRPVCLGRISPESDRSRMFAMMAGVGFDAHAVAGISHPLKRILGRGAYYAEILRQLVTFPFPTYRVSVDGTTHEAVSLVVAKGRYYGGRYVLAPEARLEDPRFHVCLFQRGGIRAALGYGLALQRGRIGESADFRIVAGCRVVIEAPPGSPRQADPLQADGDIVSELPVVIETAPAALHLVMPGRRPVSP